MSVGGPGTTSLWIPRGDGNHFICKAKVFVFIPSPYAVSTVTESGAQLVVSPLPPAVTDMLWHFPAKVVFAAVF